MKLLAIACLMFSSVAFAQSDVARSVGRVAGQFGVGVTDTIRDSQPQWETIRAKSKDECLKESGGVLDNAFVRCRNGRQEYVQYNSKNERMVLRERPIPVN